MVFEGRMAALKALASRYPSWTARPETEVVIRKETRTTQRILKELEESGYLERYGSAPTGWRIKPEQFEEFKGL